MHVNRLKFIKCNKLNFKIYKLIKEKKYYYIIFFNLKNFNCFPLYDLWENVVLYYFLRILKIKISRKNEYMV